MRGCFPQGEPNRLQNFLNLIKNLPQAEKLLVDIKFLKQFKAHLRVREVDCYKSCQELSMKENNAFVDVKRFPARI